MLQVQSPYPQFFEITGAPLENGNIYIGVANQNPETNPIVLYYDNAATIPAAQPVKVSGGYPVRNGTPTRLYTAVEDYSITVRDSKGSIVYTLPAATTMSNLQLSLAASTGAGLVGWSQLGAGAIATDVQTKLRESLSVKDFGALGDGVTDDRIAIQAAADYAKTIGANVFFPPGVYLVSPGSVNNGGVSVVDASGVSFLGVPGKSIIKTTAATYTNRALVQFLRCSDFMVTGLTFDWNNVAASSPVNGSLFCDSCDRYAITQNKFLNITTMGLAQSGARDCYIANNSFYKNTATGATQNQAINNSESGRLPQNVWIVNNYCEKTAILCNGEDLFLIGNRIRDWGFGGGIVVEIGVTNLSQRATIANNIITGGLGVLDVNAYMPGGLEIWAPYSNITGNVLTSNGGNGIDLGGQYSSFTGNTVMFNGTSGNAGWQSAIAMRGDNPAPNCASYCNISGNTLVDARVGSATQKYCYLEYNPSSRLTGITLSGNNLVAGTSKYKSISSTMLMIDGYYRLRFAWTPGTIPPGGNANIQVTSAGAELGGMVAVQCETTLANAILTANVHDVNNVMVNIYNETSSSLTLTAPLNFDLAFQPRVNLTQ